LTSAGTLVGPFDFEETVSRQKSIVSMEHWSKLSDYICYSITTSQIKQEEMIP
jgi:hypothetical protein